MCRTAGERAEAFPWRETLRQFPPQSGDVAERRTLGPTEEVVYGIQTLRSIASFDVTDERCVVREELAGH
jgi:hypothetical protein